MMALEESFSDLSSILAEAGVEGVAPDGGEGVAVDAEDVDDATPAVAVDWDSMSGGEIYDYLVEKNKRRGIMANKILKFLVEQKYVTESCGVNIGLTHHCDLAVVSLGPPPAVCSFGEAPVTSLWCYNPAQRPKWCRSAPLLI